MDFERQKPISDEYRENWERVFQEKERESTNRLLEGFAQSMYSNGSTTDTKESNG